MRKQLLLICIPLILSSCAAVNSNSSSVEVPGNFNEPDLVNLVKTDLSDTNKDIIIDFTNLSVSKIFTKPDNTIYSPTSYLLALAMLSEIASDELYAELLEVLNFTNQEEVRMFAKNLFTSAFVDGDSKLRLANSTWVHDVFTPNQNTIDNLVEHFYSSYYYGNLYSDDASNLLDRWLKEVTYDLIDLDSFSTHPLRLPDVLTVLFSSIYASSSWSTVVYKNQIQFTDHEQVTNTVDGIGTTERLPYANNEDFESSFLPLKDGFSFLTIKPVNGIANFLNDPTLLARAIDKKNYNYVNVAYKMPVFEIESEIDLLETSKEIGLNSVQSSGQLNNLIEGPTYLSPIISNITQNAKIIVDEKGVKAAAVTSTEIMYESIGDPITPISYIVDEPFIFVFLYNGIPHFLGTIYDL